MVIFSVDGAPVDPGLLRALVDVPPFGSDVQVWSDGPIAMASAPFRLPPDGPLDSRRSLGARPIATPDSSLLVQGETAVVFDGRLDDRPALLSLLAPHTDRNLDRLADVELIALAYRTSGTACMR